MHYTLYAAPGSCSFAPHIVMEEIGRPYSLALMSPGHPETKTDEFRRFNPKGRIPVLIAENFTLTEAPAIFLHLGLTNPDTGLLGADAANVVRSIEWFNWLSSAVHAVAVRMIWRADFFLPDETMYAPLVERGKERLASAFALIDTKMKDRVWAIGECYSIVDPYLLVFYRWGNRMAIDMQNTYPAWTTHTRRLEERAAVQRAIAQEGISLWE
ncbi:glutathione binding-like protein [Mesorhizobium sp.]|uniref:glutathione S-transferase family protein n=1 Tax=Mesorhizobium sp. TaxID=1871066 RepID=UPI000FE9B3F7|nr:glutathione binding-like protein [Mesorhizobium sp.]RWN33467.1 MAG: glutathione S-transferase family protein [Mesorhizobium sp.]